MLSDTVLARMRAMLECEDEPDSMEWFDTVEALLDEVDRLKSELSG